MRSYFVLPAITLVMALPVSAPQSAGQPDGYWDDDKVNTILDKTITVRIAPDLAALSDNEKRAVTHLLAVGKLLHEAYLEQTHHQGLAALADLQSTNAPNAEDLAALFRIFKGPIATTLDNTREPFLPVDAAVAGKNVYPWGISRAAVNAFIQANPDVDLLDGRTVVRRASAANLEHDLNLLKTYPALDTLQPGLRDHLQQLRKHPDAKTLYALPYSVAYAERMMKAYAHLRDAARVMREEDPDFSAYLENRARDLLANDYEAGDAAWVSGDFNRLNAQIGSFETYDDGLFGVKSFFSASVLVKDEARSRALDGAIAGIQAIENSLPYDRHKKVRADIPAGVYNVIADFGQARGTNTASILPNDADHARKYGRVILLRYNIMTNPELFRDTQAAWKAAVAKDFADDLTLEAGFQRTLWHEIGHYLGVATDEKGRRLSEALKENSDLLEEMKADLVSLYAGPALQKSGYYTADELQALYADGIRRTLQKVKPRREQPYQTMQLMQLNYFLETGVLTFDEDSGRLGIRYAQYHDVVGKLLREVLAIQSAGDADRAEAFIRRYTAWDDERHGVIARNMRDAAKYRYRLVRYEALGE